MKVSIIVPIYNVEQYIEECLNSIYNQELADFECRFKIDMSQQIEK